MTSFVVFVGCCLVVILTGHYIGLLSVVLLISLYSLAAHGARRDGVLGLVASIAVFIGSPSWTCRTCAPPTCSSPARRPRCR